MSSRHFGTRVRELLNFTSLQNSAIEDHTMSCNNCSEIGFGLDNFSVIRKCEADYHAEIHEALLIKKLTPNLNKKLYAVGACCLLQLF